MDKEMLLEDVEFEKQYNEYIRKALDEAEAEERAGVPAIPLEEARRMMREKRLSNAG